MSERAGYRADRDERTPRPNSPSWDAVFLICKKCRKRSKAPKGLKAKALAATVRAHSREQRPRPRIVLTSCLGLCPTGAIAVAFVGRGGWPRIVPIESCEQLDAVIPLLIAPSS